MLDGKFAGICEAYREFARGFEFTAEGASNLMLAPAIV